MPLPKNRESDRFLTPLLFFIMITSIALPSLAIETNVSLHQGSESETQGFSFYVADNFTKGSDFYWGIGYSILDDVKVDISDYGEVEWDEDDLFFKVETIDAIVSYRYKPKTYNNFMKQVTFEYQVGATITLTENKFLWNSQNLDHEIYFSKSNDINALIGFSAHYKMSHNTAINVGFKYHPSFSEFEDITSVYIGFTYKFGNQFGY
ncbi:hypothetical protein AADZ91_12560 [Colwelliaceae bacterium 6441]